MTKLSSGDRLPVAALIQGLHGAASRRYRFRRVHTSAATRRGTRAAHGARARWRRRRGATAGHVFATWRPRRSEEHTSELQSLMRISYAVFCLKKKKQ